MFKNSYNIYFCIIYYSFSSKKLKLVHSSLWPYRRPEQLQPREDGYAEILPRGEAPQNLHEDSEDVGGGQQLPLVPALG
ncbi:unnamed protein product [Spirodela intermedia]|uniref:Uncharacterized protein n=1 Tax=Spirodela intermedia TaxID=51605 RepID=A0A7I8LBV9_SPIIN|nr:unnamed protein product [Spirodela intermedia]